MEKRTEHPSIHGIGSGMEWDRETDTEKKTKIIATKRNTERSGE